MIINHIPQNCCTRPRHLQTLLRGMIILLSCLKNAHGQDEVVPNTAGQSPMKSTTTATEKTKPTFAELKAEVESLENFADRQDFVEKITFSFSSEDFEQSLGFPLKGKTRVVVREFSHTSGIPSAVIRSFEIDGKALDPNSEAAREELNAISGEKIPLTNVGTFPHFLINPTSNRLSALMNDPGRVHLSWENNDAVLEFLIGEESRGLTGSLRLQTDKDGRWVPVQFEASPETDVTVTWQLSNLSGNSWYTPYYLPRGTIETLYRNETKKDDVVTNTFEVLFRLPMDPSRASNNIETSPRDQFLPNDMIPRDEIGSTDGSIPSHRSAARIVELESKIADLESRADHDDAQLFDLKAELGRLKGATEAGDALGNYEREKLIPELKASFAILLAELGPKHPRVEAIERQIAALELAAKPHQTSVTVFYLKHAKAKETSEKIEQLYPEREAQVVVEERNNSLLIRGDEATIHKYEQLLEVLDADDLSSPQQAKLPGGTSSFGGDGFGGVRSTPGAAGSSSTPAQSTTNNSVSPEEEPNADTEQLKIFSLKFSNANDTLKIVQSLFGLPSVKVAADERTNSLIVSGDADSLSEIEAILLKLDSNETAASPSNPLASRNGGNTIAAPTPIAEFRQRLDALELPVQQLAEQVRATEAKLGKDHADSAKLRDELRALVQKTFTARQEIQRAELAEFTRRLQRMQQSIDTRAKIAEKIVDRRVEELLNPDTSWEAQRSRLDGPNLPISRPRDNGVASAPLTEGKLITKTYAVGNFVSAVFFQNVTAPTNSTANSPASLDAAADKIRQKAEELITQISSHNKPAAISFDSARLQLVVSHTAEGHLALDELFATLKLPMQENLTFTCYEIAKELDAALKGAPVWQAFGQIMDNLEEGGWIGTPKKELVNWFERVSKELPDGDELGQPTPFVLAAGVPRQLDFGETRVVLTARIDPVNQQPQLRVDYLNGGNVGTGMASDLDDLAVYLFGSEDIIFLAFNPLETRSTTANDPSSRPLQVAATEPQVKTVQIRLRSDRRMSIDSGDVVFAEAGWVATVNVQVGTPRGFSFADGEARGPYRLYFERNGSSKEAQAWLEHNTLPVAFLADDQQRAATGQLVAKVFYLKSGGREVDTLSSDRVEAGVDPVSVAAEKGTVIGVVKISKGAIRLGASDVAPESNDTVKVAPEKLAGPPDKDPPIQNADQVNIPENPTTHQSIAPLPPNSKAKELNDLVFESAVAADETSPPESDAEKAIARMVFVFFQDEARRAVPGLMIDHGTETLVLTGGSASIVPMGVGHAIDRSFIEIPSEPDVEAEFFVTKTADLRFHRAKPGLTKFKLEKAIDLAIGDSLSAIILSGKPTLRVTPNATRISALDQATSFSLDTHKFRHEFSGLVQIDQRLPEGTPLFKDGQLAGITLLGTRFMKDDVPGSYVVPASRIVDVLKTMKTK